MPGVKGDLNDLGPIAEVHEHQSTEVPAAVHPSTEANRLADMGQSQDAALMRSKCGGQWGFLGHDLSRLAGEWEWNGVWQRAVESAVNRRSNVYAEGVTGPSLAAAHGEHGLLAVHVNGCAHSSGDSAKTYDARAGLEWRHAGVVI